MFAVSAFSQGQLAKIQSRFSHETDPVGKAKLMPALGQAEFQEIQKDSAAGRLPEALAMLRQYRDAAATCAKLLDATGVDAGKHASGFKQLQISLRESLRRLDALLPGMTADEQAPCLIVRKDLDQMNLHLIEQLFPGRAAKPQS
jgi:hypothetical protein